MAEIVRHLSLLPAAAARTIVHQLPHRRSSEGGLMSTRTQDVPGIAYEAVTP
ncbi:MAG TPA: hypothetical protein VFP06_01850 [Acidimicrobiales bacterium]|nr:hypothetical protein [Acidimicrobiales bacterium]